MAAEDSAQRKADQEAGLKRSEQAKTRDDKGRSAFDKLNMGRLEPKVNASQLTLLNTSCTDILILNKDVL